MKKSKKVDFVFFVHPRSAKDIIKQYPILRFLPEKFVEYLISLIPYIILEKTKPISKNGFVVAIPMTARLMLKDKNRAKRKILRAIKSLNKKYGIKYFGLGALTSSVSSGGEDFVKDEFVKNNEIYLTNGNALTALASFDALCKIMQEQEDRIRTIAVLGATGSIGSALSKMIAKEFDIDELIILGRTKSNLDALFELLQDEKPDKLKVKISTNIDELHNADLSTIATSAQSAIVEFEHIKDGAIVYDITQPRNISKDVAKRLKEEKSAMVYSGGLVYNPNTEKRARFQNFLPDNSQFACFTETALVAEENIKKHFCIGKVQDKHMEHVKILAQKHKIKTNLLFDFV